MRGWTEGGEVGREGSGRERGEVQSRRPEGREVEEQAGGNGEGAGGGRGEVRWREMWRGRTR